MSRFTLAIIVVVTFLGWNASTGQTKPPKVMAEFKGASLKWINLAEPEFARRNLDLDKYFISVVEQDDSVMVSLMSSDSAPGARGNTGTYPGFEVEISRKDRKVVRANFVR